MKLTWQPGSWKSGVLALANFHTCCWVEGVWWEPECHTHEQICRQSSQSEADKRQTRIVVFLFCYYFIYLFFLHLIPARAPARDMNVNDAKEYLSRREIPQLMEVRLFHTKISKLFMQLADLATFLKRKLQCWRVPVNGLLLLVVLLWLWLLFYFIYYYSF